MRSWRKTLGMLVCGLLSLAAAAAPAGAQYPSPEGGGPPADNQVHGGHGHKDKGDPFTMTVEGPNAFTDRLSLRARNSGFGPGPLRYLMPGILQPRPTLATPACFPDAAVCGNEDASPFTVQEGGPSNGFTELSDPNPGHPLLRWLGARRLLFTEFIEGPRNDPLFAVFRYEYLLWDISRTGPAAPLVTTNNAFPAQTGTLIQPNTVAIVPASTSLVDFQTMQAARVTTGLAIGYLPPIEIGMYSFRRMITPYAEGSLDATTRLLARPVQFLNVPVAPGAGQENVIPVNTPGVLAGAISINSKVTFWSLDASFFFNVIDGDALRSDVILGYRHNGLYENFDITQTTGGRVGIVTLNGAALPPLFSVQVLDHFRTENTFDGGQIGLRNILQWGRLGIFSDAKIAVGMNYQHVSINGTTTLIQPVAGRPTQSFAGGVLALPSNSGTSTNSILSISPEVNAALSYQVSRNFRVFVGYNLTYWTNVLRAPDHVSNIVDSRQIRVHPSFNAAVTGIAPPFPAHVQRDFFARGYFFGIEMGF